MYICKIKSNGLVAIAGLPQVTVTNTPLLLDAARECFMYDEL
jgi:hypothetical protein